MANDKGESSREDMGETPRADNKSGKAGHPAGGIYDDHDQALAGYAKAVAEDYQQDFVENAEWRYKVGDGAIVPRTDGPVTSARKSVNFGTDIAQKRANKLNKGLN